MMAVAPPNLDLMSYLVGQLAATRSQRFEALLEYMPSARPEDWELVTAGGQRVQVIAPPDRKKVGVLQFGTQLITSSDRSIGGMLGASPGASTATDIMLSCWGTMFPGARPPMGAHDLPRMVPSFGTSLSDDAQAAHASLERTAASLGLDHD